MTSSKKNIVVSSLKMSMTTMVSRLFGLVRDEFQANFLGTTWASDAFTVAFWIPNLLRRLFAEGAMTASFVPVFMEVEANRTQLEARRFFATFFTLLFLVLSLVVLLGILITPYLVRLLYLSGSVSAEVHPAIASRNMPSRTYLRREPVPRIYISSCSSPCVGSLRFAD